MDGLPSPYVKCARFEIYYHLPPKPTSRRYHECRKSDFDEQNMTFTERSQKHLPLPGETPESEKKQITITKEIAVHGNHGAQVVGIDVDMVAELYDPRYYPKLTPTNDVYADPFRCADFHYSHEARAYERVSDGPYSGTICSKVSWLLFMRAPHRTKSKANPDSIVSVNSR